MVEHAFSVCKAVSSVPSSNDDDGDVVVVGLRLIKTDIKVEEEDIELQKPCQSKEQRKRESMFDIHSY